ncbi:MAG: metallophosphoesterase, partial [Acidobacteria bacterium]|nr:metallophosphoesterase [Acidobacteriota bacterium]
FHSAGDGAFRFLVFGDSGDGGEPQRALAKRLVAEEAGFVAHVGDIAYWQGNFTQFAETFFWVYPQMLARMTVFPVPGNHDYEFQDALAYRSYFSVPAGNVDAAGRGRYYSFDWGPAHFSVIDSNTSLKEAVAGRGEMLRWLDEDLKRTRQPWRIVMVHHPPFPTTPDKLQDALCAMVAQYVTPILERNGVQLLLAGHEHIYQRTKSRRGQVFVGDPGGTVYVTTGGGGSQFYPPGEAGFVSASTGGSHYLRVDVDRLRLKIEMVDAVGAVKDTWILSSAPMMVEPALFNAATFSASYAPGGLVSLFGWNLSAGEMVASGQNLPLELGGTKLSLDGKDVALLYASPTQVNAVLPYETAGAARLIARTSLGESSVAFESKAVAPALFSWKLGGREIVSALHADGSLVDEGRPALPGEWIVVFGTGLGKMKDAPVYGQPARLVPLSIAEGVVSATVDGQIADVYFAGLAPGFWGLNQVNLRVPAVSGRKMLQVFVGGVGSSAIELPVR